MSIAPTETGTDREIDFAEEHFRKVAQKEEPKPPARRRGKRKKGQ